MSRPTGRFDPATAIGATLLAGMLLLAFLTVGLTVLAYAHNLNTHHAYREFRRMRAALRKDGRPIDGLTLADTLTRYSERGGDYVRTLKQMMRANDLPPLDGARLRNDRRPILIVERRS